MTKRTDAGQCFDIRQLLSRNHQLANRYIPVLDMHGRWAYRRKDAASAVSTFVLLG